MNWGKKILIFYLAFVAGITFLVIKSMYQEQELVTPDYYEQELKYQQRIDQKGRADALKKHLKLFKQSEGITIEFPSNLDSNYIKGDVWIYCANDQKKDLKQSFKLNSGERIVTLNYKTHGVRLVKISWEIAGIKYYTEEKINL